MVYAKMSAAMPRSGGDYVYNSRLATPALGFAGNVSFTLAMIFIVAAGGAYTSVYGLGPLLQVVGFYWSRPSFVHAGNWCVSSVGVFSVGILVIVAASALFIFTSMSTYWRVQKVLVLLATLSLVIVALWAMLVSKHTAFAHIANELHNLNGKSLAPLAAGRQPAFSFWESFRALLWPMFAIQGCIFSSYIGGEVKQPARTQLVGMLSSMGWLTAWVLIIVVGMLHVFGQPFFANLSLADPAKYGFSSTPGYPMLVALGLGNRFLAVILLAFFSLWGVTFAAVCVAISSRCVFAWSLDRIVPEWLSRVSSRWHSPYNAIFAVAVAGAIFDVLFSWHWLTLLGANIGFFAMYFILCASVVLFPRRFPSLWGSSPGANRFLGLPTIVWWGILLVAANATFTYLTSTDPVAGVSLLHNFGQWIVFPVIIVVAGALYYVSRAVQRRRRIDLDLNFREVPPE
jgi:amino acid transporter